MIIGLVLFQVIAYAWIHLYLSYRVGTEVSPTASVAFFTVCVGELSICGLLKKSNKKEKSDDEAEG